jgi:hypothetical protein
VRTTTGQQIKRGAAFFALILTNLNFFMRTPFSLSPDLLGIGLGFFQISRPFTLQNFFSLRATKLLEYGILCAIVNIALNQNITIVFK